MSRLIFNQLTTTPSDTDAGSSQLYLKDDGNLYLKNASNTEAPLLTGTSPFPTVSSGRLDVHGDVNFGVDGTGALQQESTTVRFKHTSTGEVHLMTHDGNEDINLNSAGYIQFEAAGTEAMRIDANNKVGIGTTVPSELLSVAGAVSATTTAKAWARWDGTGGAHAEVAGATYNVSSIANNGTGDYTVNLTTATGFGNGMCVVGSAGDSNYSGADTNLNFRHDVSSTTTIDVIVATDGGADHSDCDQICLVAFNTQ